MTPAAFPFPEIRRCNSLPAFQIAALSRPDGSPVPLTAAALEIRPPSGSLLKRFASADGSLVIDPAHTVTLGFISGLETAALAPGTYQYDLLVHLASGESWTVLAGPVHVAPAITPSPAHGVQADLTLTLQPLQERVCVEVRPPAPLHALVPPPACAAVHLHAVQAVPHVHLEVGPQIGVPGAACVPPPRANPVFTYAGTRLVPATFGDGFVREFSYDSAGRLAQSRDI
jgi:hypothetical protein